METSSYFVVRNPQTNLFMAGWQPGYVGRMIWSTLRGSETFLSYRDAEAQCNLYRRLGKAIGWGDMMFEIIEIKPQVLRIWTGKMGRAGE